MVWILVCGYAVKSMWIHSILSATHRHTVFLEWILFLVCLIRNFISCLFNDRNVYLVFCKAFLAA